MSNYKNQIGDGKLPNKYWVFQYDQKFQRSGEDGCINPIENGGLETKDSLLGEFKTFKQALACVDDKAYLPNVVIEDRLSGVVFEQMVIVCPCCGKEDYETINDIRFTKETLGEDFQ